MLNFTFNKVLVYVYIGFLAQSLFGLRTYMLISVIVSSFLNKFVLWCACSISILFKLDFVALCTVQ